MTDAGEVCCKLSFRQLCDLHHADVAIEAGDFVPAEHSLTPAKARPSVSNTILHRLNAYAARTYVPASEQSRARGAGAGLRDED